MLGDRDLVVCETQIILAGNLIYQMYVEYLGDRLAFCMNRGSVGVQGRQ